MAANQITYLNSTNYTEYVGSIGDLQTWTANMYVGEVLSAEISSGSLSFGQLCYKDSNGRWSLATGSIANAAAINMLGICLQDAPTVYDPTKILVSGLVQTNYTIESGEDGTPLFMSASQAGYTTYITPATSGNIVRLIGYNIVDSGLQSNGVGITYFNPDNTWIELT